MMYGMGRGMGPNMMFGYSTEAYAGLDLAGTAENIASIENARAYRAVCTLVRRWDETADYARHVRLKPVGTKPLAL
jgi:hypothetical protein